MRLWLLFYLVAAHVVTRVHDDWLPTVVALADVQAGFGAEIFQLVRKTNVKANLRMWQRLQNAEENFCSVHKSTEVNKWGRGTHSTKLLRVQIRKVDFWVDVG